MSTVRWGIVSTADIAVHKVIPGMRRVLVSTHGRCGSRSCNMGVSCIGSGMGGF